MILEGIKAFSSHINILGKLPKACHQKIGITWITFINCELTKKALFAIINSEW
jgi:hypothetical protein